MTPHDETTAAPHSHRRPGTRREDSPHRSRPGENGPRPRRPRRLALLATAGTVAAACLIVGIIVAVSTAGSGNRHAPASAALIGTTTGTGPLPVVFAQVEGWHGGKVRPAAIYVGLGGAPFATGLKWSRWTAVGAQASGTLSAQKPGCMRPIYQCPYQRFGVTVTLSQARTHDGARYWSLMRWTYSQALVQHVISWQIGGGYWRS